MSNEQDIFIKNIRNEKFVQECDANEYEYNKKELLLGLKDFYCKKSEKGARKLIGAALTFNKPKEYMLFREIIMIVYRSDIYVDLRESFLIMKKCDSRFICFLFIAMYFMVRKHDKNVKFDNYLDLVKIDECRTTDQCIFTWIKGIFLIRKEKFKEGFECIEKVYKMKRFRHIVKNDYEELTMLSKNKMHKNYSKTFIGKIVHYGLINQCRLVVTSNAHFYRIMTIYLPMICYRNMCNQCYLVEKSEKIDLHKISDFFNVELEEITFNLLKCIDKGLIKGYISDSKNVLVLSKTMPFPNLL